MQHDNTEDEWLYFHGKDFNIHYILETSTIKGERPVAFLWQQCLPERTTMLRYTYIAVFVSRVCK
jgi:hypothetical protein